jgi:predicted DNA-binding transcriptional regulator AlpA
MRISPARKELAVIFKEKEFLMFYEQPEKIDAIELMYRLKVSDTTLWRMVCDGRLPEPSIEGNKRYWNLKALQTFMDD